VWPELVQFLVINASIEAKTLFEYLVSKYPDKGFQPGQLRTLQRRIKKWKAASGNPKEAFFAQDHCPGKRSQSDYTSMNKLNITIAGEPFPHLLYHFVLTYSNWESADICFSESFESLSDGFQNALFRLGAVPSIHQTDGLSAAVNNLTQKRDFTQKYQALLSHYALEGRRTNASSPNENGDIEKSNDLLKKAIDQRLMLRMSRDFPDRKSYNCFVQQVVSELNSSRTQRVSEELAVMQDLPNGRLEACTRYSGISVSKQSLIHVLHNTYSVPSRLIGLKVTVLAYSEHLQIWYGNSCLETLPRLRGEYRYAVNYRHIIDSLVRKPGAFENYKYRSELFLSTYFRLAYDALCTQKPARADAEYLKILHFAAYNSEDCVDRALNILLNDNSAISVEAVKALTDTMSEYERPQDPHVAAIDLEAYDSLFQEGATACQS
jgi:transposase